MRRSVTAQGVTEAKLAQAFCGAVWLCPGMPDQTPFLSSVPGPASKDPALRRAVTRGSK